MSDMPNPALTFVQDTKNHGLTVLHSTGEYLHLRMRKPGSGDYCFDINCWPGHMAVTGDMGEYMFQLSKPAAEHFADCKRQPDGTYSVDPNYWAHRLVGGETGRERDPEAFETFLNGLWRTVCGKFADKHPILEKWVGESIDTQVTDCLRHDTWESAEEELRAWSYEWTNPENMQRVLFEFDGELPDLTRLTFHFQWVMQGVAMAFDHLRQHAGDAEF